VQRTNSKAAVVLVEGHKIHRHDQILYYTSCTSRARLIVLDPARSVNDEGGYCGGGDLGRQLVGSYLDVGAVSGTHLVASKSMAYGGAVDAPKCGLVARSLLCLLKLLVGQAKLYHAEQQGRSPTVRVNAGPNLKFATFKVSSFAFSPLSCMAENVTFDNDNRTIRNGRS
jgi:hypothetical protein